MTTRNEEPIACTLNGSDYNDRVAWIAQLHRDGLRSHRRDGATLELHFAAAVRDRVHQLVKQEAECCRFLQFVVDESPDRVTVTIAVPEGARDMADDLLSPFLPPAG